MEQKFVYIDSCNVTRVRDVLLEIMYLSLSKAVKD
jgi:hypothetical protein